MAQSHKVYKSVGALNVSGKPIFVDSTGDLSLPHTTNTVNRPSSTTVNALARFEDTTGSSLDSGPVTLSDDGTFSSTGDLHFKSDGGLTLSASSLSVSKGSITQTGSLTEGVTINEPAGQIVTVTATTAADSTESFVVTNSAVSSTSVVLVSLLYGGAHNSDGVPVVSVNNVSDGAFTVNITNAHPSNALSGIIKVHFLVL